MVHYFGFKYWGQVVGNIPCINELRVFILRANRTFADETATWIPGSRDLGGCSRKMKVGDVNGDGRPDVVYAVNQEDGRLQASISDMSAQLAALISNGRAYEVKRLGAPDWYHSVGVGRLSDGTAFVTGAGFISTSNKAWVHGASGTFQQAAGTLPAISPNAFEFLSLPGSQGTDYLLQTGIFPNLYGIEGWRRQANGSWTSVGATDFPYPQVGQVKFVSYTGEEDKASTVAVHVRNGRYVLGAGTGDAITESCQLKLSPGSDPIIAYRIGLAEVIDYQPGVTQVVYQGDSLHRSGIIPTAPLGAARVAGGQVQTVQLSINGEVIDNINVNFIGCKDVSGDGYDDLVVYPYNDNGLPYVYLNNQDSTFSYIGHARFPQLTLPWGNAASSILHDFDRDGLPDLLVFPANGITSSEAVSYRYFRGVRPLRVGAD